MFGKNCLLILNYLLYSLKRNMTPLFLYCRIKTKFFHIFIIILESTIGNWVALTPGLLFFQVIDKDIYEYNLLYIAFKLKLFKWVTVSFPLQGRRKEIIFRFFQAYVAENYSNTFITSDFRVLLSRAQYLQCGVREWVLVWNVSDHIFNKIW